MKTLYLVSCVAQKRKVATQAQDLYLSAWFRKARRYVESKRATWRILSAKYGVLEPASLVEPYEQTLSKMSTIERREWARRVLMDLRPLVAPGDMVVFLAGDRYRESLVPALREMAVHVEVPMEGLQIGRQLQWLDRAVS